MMETTVLGANNEQDSRNVPEAAETGRAKDGRYIPYSGGSLGWYENAGVMKSELNANYRLSSVLDPAAIRQKQFERWGEIGNRRNEDRTYLESEVEVTVSSAGQAWRAKVVDVAPHGMRLRSLDAIALKVHDSVRLVVDDGGSRLDFEAEVMWLQETGKLRPVFNLGLAFPGLSPEDSARLQARVSKK